MIRFAWISYQKISLQDRLWERLKVSFWNYYSFLWINWSWKLKKILKIWKKYRNNRKVWNIFKNEWKRFFSSNVLLLKVTWFKLLLKNAWFFSVRLFTSFFGGGVRAETDQNLIWAIIRDRHVTRDFTVLLVFGTVITSCKSQQKKTSCYKR